jgi:glyoxylase-like metal-dependent hydrolase (beta-lactamase superfamily II)
MSLKVHTIVNNPISSNCHIIYDGLRKRGIVVDPGSEDCGEILSFIHENEICVDYVILTHEHFDHTWASDKINGIVLCTKECKERLSNRKLNLSVFFNQVGFELNVKAECIEDLGEKFSWNNYKVEFCKNGAHSPGGLMFVVDKYVVTGDFLIKDLKTVTKLKWAQKEELSDGEKWLQELKGIGLLVLAGHGDCFELDNYDLNKIY